MLLTGLNGNFDIQYETIVMNGSTLVATTGLYLEILELECLTFGSYGRNSARIVASSGAGINALIEPGMNKSNGAIFPVPRGYEARITRFGGNYVVPVSGEFVRLSLEAFIGEGKTTPVALDNVRLSGDGESCIIKEVEPIVVPEKSVVYMNGIATALNQKVWGGFDLLLLEKPK